jgi:hypothetical protein
MQQKTRQECRSKRYKEKQNSVQRQSIEIVLRDFLSTDKKTTIFNPYLCVYTFVYVKRSF